MDWWKTLDANLQSAVIGGLLATLPLLLGLIVQLYIHESEKRQKQKEAIVNLREKWMERDILTAMELLDKLLKSYSQSDFLDKRLKVFEVREVDGRIGEDEFREGVISFREGFDNLFLERQQIHERLSVLMVSINDAKVAEAFREFTSEVTKLQDQKFKVDNVHLIIRAGTLHKALRDKLISIRDT